MADCQNCRHKKAFPSNTPCSRCINGNKFQPMTSEQRKRKHQQEEQTKHKAKSSIDIAREAGLMLMPPEDKKPESASAKPNATADSEKKPRSRKKPSAEAGND